MKCNAAGRALIQTAEGCKLKTYICPAGRPTIGWGHTEGVKPGQVITQHQADVIFESDLEMYEEGVEGLFERVPLTENQFSALVSFAFNFGVTRLAGSTLRKKIQRKDLTAADEFPKWIHAAGVVQSGLVIRRAAERELFLSLQ